LTRDLAGKRDVRSVVGSRSRMGGAWSRALDVFPVWLRLSLEEYLEPPAACPSSGYPDPVVRTRLET